MAVVVTGGAGYIGAHLVRVLQGTGRDVVVVDDLSTGRESRVPGVPLVRLDLAEADGAARLERVLRDNDADELVHLAARKRVDESVARPLWYYQQNVTGLAHVLEAVTAAGVGRVVFSSSAAVYGDTHERLVREQSATVPVNPYGETKLIGEWLLRDCARAGTLRAVALRYFNVAGSGWPELGDPAVLNLVTMVLERLSRHEAPRIFGSDYETPDGTCVRDFVHVMDLAEAHVAALDHLARPDRPAFEAFNVGTGRGASVLEVVQQLVALAGADVAPVLEGRRAGDPPSVVAQVDRFHETVGWRATRDLSEVLASAWSAWQHQERPPG
ncbi:UDP-glucose 4-epimerase GalE [Cellulomonas sp. URHB0016]